ncbi:hypothetical protein LXL04_016193 [Taraxacum kok-saghyz]
MHVLCSLLPGKGHCRGKLTDVTHGEKRPIMGRAYTLQRNSEYDEEITQTDTRNWLHATPPYFRRRPKFETSRGAVRTYRVPRENFTTQGASAKDLSEHVNVYSAPPHPMWVIKPNTSCLAEDSNPGPPTGKPMFKTVLETGNPSRNVIEKIFITTTDITRCSVSIKQVLKLNHSRESLERFESFREGVKNKAYEHSNNHPRNMVDGNEQLLFYGTNVPCCTQIATSNLCRDSNCNICILIKSGFNTTKNNTGIWLSTSCQDLINANRMKLKMAIIFCRVITGRVVNRLDRDCEGNYDSIGEVKSNYLYVRNPSAVLPCFVIILNCT